MKFQEPEIVEMGSAGELIEITMFQDSREDLSQPEPTKSSAIYACDDE